MTCTENKDLSELCSRHSLAYMILFGSRASGKWDRLSDWDFAARYGKRPSLSERLALIRDLSGSVCSDDIDLVVIDEISNPPLLFNILWGGKPVCVRDREILAWDRVRAASLYWDWRIAIYPLLADLVMKLARREDAEKDKEIR